MEKRGDREAASESERQPRHSLLCSCAECIEGERSPRLEFATCARASRAPPLPLLLHQSRRERESRAVEGEEANEESKFYRRVREKAEARVRVRGRDALHQSSAQSRQMKRPRERRGGTVIT